MLHILTLTWNGLHHLEKLRDGLVQTCCNFYDTAWYIKDNGSKDESVKSMEKWGERWPILRLDIMETGHNRDSFAKGMNVLFERADPADDDLVLLLNNDVQFREHPHDNAVSHMHQLMNQTKAGMVGLRLLYQGTDKLQHAGVIFSDRYNKMPYHYRPGEKSDANAEKNRYFQAVTAAVCLVKASSWKRVGGMDETFKWAFEDVDLCLRIGQDEKIAYCGETFAFHEESASLKKNPVNKMFMGTNATYFKEKWLGSYEIDHDRYLKDTGYNEIK